MDQSQSYEYIRRAVRLTPTPDVKIQLKANGLPLTDPVIVDMSTLGMGIKTDFDPGDTALSIVFLSPEILAGMDLRILIRQRKKYENEPGFFIGFEYQFSSSEQENTLLRWLSTYFYEVYQKNLAEISENSPSAGSSDTVSSLKPARLSVHFPRHEKELEELYYLLQPLQLHHSLLQTKYFAGAQDQKLVGAIPLIMDTSAFGLPADSYFPDFLKQLRQEQRRLGEIGTAKFNESAQYFQENPSSIIRKLNVLFSLFLNLVVYSQKYAHLTDLLVICPPHLQEFYRLWFFQDLRNQVDTRVLNQSGLQGCRLMILDLEMLDQKLAMRRPELLAHLKRHENSANWKLPFQKSYFPDLEFFERWFLKKHSVLKNLTPEQKIYFASLFPQLILP